MKEVHVGYEYLVSHKKLGWFKCRVVEVEEVFVRVVVTDTKGHFELVVGEEVRVSPSLCRFCDVPPRDEDE